MGPPASPPAEPLALLPPPSALVAAGENTKMRLEMMRQARLKNRPPPSQKGPKAAKVPRDDKSATHWDEALARIDALLTGEEPLAPSTAVLDPMDEGQLPALQEGVDDMEEEDEEPLAPKQRQHRGGSLQALKRSGAASQPQTPRSPASTPTAGAAVHSSRFGPGAEKGGCGGSSSPSSPSSSSSRMQPLMSMINPFRGKETKLSKMTGRADSVSSTPHSTPSGTPTRASTDLRGSELAANLLRVRHGMAIGSSRLQQRQAREEGEEEEEGEEDEEEESIRDMDEEMQDQQYVSMHEGREMHHGAERVAASSDSESSVVVSPRVPPLQLHALSPVPTPAAKGQVVARDSPRAHAKGYSPQQQQQTGARSSAGGMSMRTVAGTGGAQGSSSTARMAAGRPQQIVFEDPRRAPSTRSNSRPHAQEQQGSKHKPTTPRGQVRSIVMPQAFVSSSLCCLGKWVPNQLIVLWPLHNCW